MESTDNTYRIMNRDELLEYNLEHGKNLALKGYPPRGLCLAFSASFAPSPAEYSRYASAVTTAYEQYRAMALGSNK